MKARGNYLGVYLCVLVSIRGGVNSGAPRALLTCVSQLESYSATCTFVRGVSPGDTAVPLECKLWSEEVEVAGRFHKLVEADLGSGLFCDPCVLFRDCYSDFTHHGGTHCVRWHRYARVIEGVGFCGLLNRRGACTVGFKFRRTPPNYIEALSSSGYIGFYYRSS